MSDSYLNSPALDLVATDCMTCGRPLLDALSVEVGVGPECRRRVGWTKRHGFGVPESSDFTAASALLASAGLADCMVEGDARATCNRVVHRLACVSLDQLPYAQAVAALAALGYRRLAEACAPALRTVRVELEGPCLAVKAPYSEAFTAAVRTIPGSRWDADRKVRLVPVDRKAALWDALRRTFDHGTLVFATRVAIL